MTRIVTDYLNYSAEEYPEKPAFCDNQRQMTYRQLQQEAFHVAMSLINRNIFKKPILIFMDKSAECIAAYMGAAYSGNFYSPLDIDMPAERIGKIVETLLPEMVVASEKCREKAEKLFQEIPVLYYEEMQKQEVEIERIRRVENQIIDTDILYVLFTSGSTGIPKGVTVSHKSVIAYACWVKTAFGFDENTIFGNQTPFYFSMSVLDIFQTLCNGATLYIIPKVLFSFPIRLLEYLNEHSINTIYWVPTALCQVANTRALEKRKPETLKKVLFAGEVMPAKQLNVWRKMLPDALYANLFGPTETTDICCYYVLGREIADTESVPIGYACRNTDLLILDEDDLPVSGHDIGELCVRGSILASGYYRNPEKTAEVFVQNPVNPDYPEIIYRTGDLVHVNERKELIYDSRKDFQIKHLGHRIELGEIEAVASGAEGVDRVCCLYHKEQKQIILFYTGTAGEEILQSTIKSNLPVYMVPSKIKNVIVMPINANGKIDRIELGKEWERMNEHRTSNFRKSENGGGNPSGHRKN